MAARVQRINLSALRYRAFACQTVWPNLQSAICNLQSAIPLAAPDELQRRFAQPDPLAATQRRGLARRKPPFADGDAGLGLRQTSTAKPADVRRISACRQATAASGRYT